ncbi:hypothetical protein U1Q18_017141 [Sarracenia purpurea var. burkii]
MHWIRRRCVGDMVMRSLEQGFRRSSRSIQRIQETTMRFVGVQDRFRFRARQQSSRVLRKKKWRGGDEPETAERAERMSWFPGMWWMLNAREERELQEENWFPA